MAIADAGKLGSAISKHKGNLDAALQEYQEERIPQTTREVCFWLLGQLHQALNVVCQARKLRPGLCLPSLHPRHALCLRSKCFAYGVHGVCHCKSFVGLLMLCSGWTQG